MITDPCNPLVDTKVRDERGVLLPFKVKVLAPANIFLVMDDSENKCQHSDVLKVCICGRDQGEHDESG